MKNYFQEAIVQRTREFNPSMSERYYYPLPIDSFKKNYKIYVVVKFWIAISNFGLILVPYTS